MGAIEVMGPEVEHGLSQCKEETENMGIILYLVVRKSRWKDER